MKRSHAIAVFLVLAIPGSLTAAETKASPPGKPATEVVNPSLPPSLPRFVVAHHLFLSPAASPRPVLKYHLLPQFPEQTPGNAALLYLKAFVTFAESGPNRQKMEEVLTRPFWNLSAEKPIPFEKLDQVPRDEVKKALATFDGAMEILSMATRRETCDWGQPVREQRDFYELLLSEVQMSRAFARFLVVKARLEITEKKYEQALATLREGFTLAHHVGQQGIIVSDLVGLVIQGMMAETLQSLIASPGAPNLYWALTELPDPLVSHRRGLELEGSAVYVLFPKLREVRTARLSPQQWQDLYQQVLVRITELAGLMAGKRPTAADVKSALEKAEPIARRELLARGWTRQQVDAMPAAQAVLVQSIEVFEEARDDLFKWYYVPFAQAAQGIGAASEQIERVKKVEGVPLASVMLPALGPCYLRAAQRQRQIAALRTIEAIRLYAANHGGALPESLDKIGEVPIPVNPVTGKPFPYKLEGATAILEADGPAESHPRQYRLTVAK